MWPFNPKLPKLPVPGPLYSDALRALRDAPGPSPWYLQNTKVPYSTGSLRWTPAGKTDSLLGKSILTDSSGLTFAVADCYCYVKVVHGNQLLVWYTANFENHSVIRLRLFSVDQLRPIPDWTERLPQLTASTRFLASADPLAALDLPTTLPDGLQTVSLPKALSSLGEFFILVSSTGDQMYLRLWTLDTATGALTVTPQDWFNRGSYDFGYQWVTRVARIPKSEYFVGEGIRLGMFLLDSTRTQVAKWLVTDSFYHPERAPLERDE